MPISGLLPLDPTALPTMEFRGATPKMKLYGEDGARLATPVQQVTSEGLPRWSAKVITEAVDEQTGEVTDGDALTWTVDGERPTLSRGARVVPVTPMIGIWPDRTSKGKNFVSLVAEGFDEA